MFDKKLWKHIEYLQSQIYDLRAANNELHNRIDMLMQHLNLYIEKQPEKVIIRERLKG